MHWIEQDKKGRHGKPLPNQKMKGTMGRGRGIRIPPRRIESERETMPPAAAERQPPAAPALPPAAPLQPASSGAQKSTPRLRGPVRKKEGTATRKRKTNSNLKVTSPSFRPRPKFKRWPGAFKVGAVTAISVTVVLSVGIGIYGYGWSGTVMQRIAKVLPLPAAYVGDQTFLLADYLLDYAALKNTTIASAVLPLESLSQRVVYAFARRTAIRRLAAAYGVSVSSDALQQAYVDVVRQAGSRQQLMATVRDKFPGWGERDFQDKILEPYMLQQRLAEKLKAGPELRELAEQQAYAIRGKIITGELTFAEAAVRWSQDAAAAVGGDAGYRSQTDLDSALFAAAQNLRVGQYSQPIQTERGVYLLMVEERVGGEAENPLRLHLRQIFIRPTDIERLLDEEIMRLGVRQLVP